MWQHEALRRYIDEQRDTPGFADHTVFLSDPVRERKLDERLLRAMWPGVLEALAPSRWAPIVNGAAGTSVHDGLRTQGEGEIGRALTFLIEDPDRPRVPGAAPPWFCRGTVSCTAARFFVAFDFTVSLPIDFPFQDTLRMLSEPRFAGYPPELRFHAGIPDVGTPALELGFNWGHGAEPWSDRRAFAAARTATEKNALAIDAVHDLERDYADGGAYDRVCERLMAAYEAF